MKMVEETEEGGFVVRREVVKCMSQLSRARCIVDDLCTTWPQVSEYIQQQSKVSEYIQQH